MNNENLNYFKSALISKKGAVSSSEIVIIILMILVIAAIVVTFIVTFINNKDDEIAENIHSNYSELDSSTEASQGGGGDSGGNLYETIPSGGVYKSGNKTYREGDYFPEPKTGDIYSYGDFEYGFNMIKMPTIIADSSAGWMTKDEAKEQLSMNDGDLSMFFGESQSNNFWCVGAKDMDKKSYGSILSSIGDKAVTSITLAFAGSQIETIPQIPDTVSQAVMAFCYCPNLKTVNYLPNSIISCAGMFSGCASLENISNIPSNAKDLTSMFSQCESLKTVPEIPEHTITIESICSHCQNLKKAPEIPDGIINMNYAFYNCRSMTTAPSRIPASVQNFRSAFENCTSLSGIICIDANPTEYPYCFDGTKKSIVLTGSSTILSKLAVWGDNVTVQE